MRDALRLLMRTVFLIEVQVGTAPAWLGAGQHGPGTVRETPGHGVVA